MDGRGMGKSDWGRMKMDKQELIEETLHLMEKSLQNKIHGVHTDFDRGVISAIEKAMRLINQLDEPQKVKIPPFVAEYLEKCKEEGLSLSMALEFSDDTDEGDAMKWLYDNRKIMNDQHVYLFVRAWVDGYEVEEPLYYVELPNLADGDPLFVIKNKYGRYDVDDFEDIKVKLTEEEIKNLDERYWQFAERVEERLRMSEYNADYANVDISRMEMKHGREVVVRALEEYLRESGMNVVSN